MSWSYKPELQADSKKEVEHEIDLVHMLTHAKKSTDNNRAPDGYLHPSELSKCSRILYWNWKYGPPNNKKDQFTVGGKFSVDIGTRIHEMLEGLMETVPDIKFETEQALVSEEDNMRGTCDGFVTMNLDGKKYVIEFKSTKSSLYEYFVHAPKKDHWQQVQTYLHMADLDIGFILYFNKDDNRMVQHRVVRDHAFIEKITNKSRYIKKSYDNDKVPSRYLSCKNLEKLDKRCANYARCKAYEAGLPVK